MRRGKARIDDRLRRALHGNIVEWTHRHEIKKETKNLPLLQVDISLLTDDICISPAHTLDLGEGVHNFTLAIHVSVQQAKNVLYHKLSEDVRDTTPIAQIARTWN